MAENKTRENDGSVEAFLSTVGDEQKRQDSYALIDIMRQAAKAEPKMWGNSNVGLGSYHYTYASGREGDAPPVGFSPRKQKASQ